MSNSNDNINPNVVAAAVFLLVLALYAFTAAPTFTMTNMGADGGDFLAAAFNWGVPHPSGYPTYVLLLRIFSFIVPIGDVAHRANLFSALMGALASLLTFYIVLDLIERNPSVSPRFWWLPVAGPAFSAFALAVSPLLWSQSTITVVYSLNAFFITLLLFLSLKVVNGIRHNDWPKSRTVKWLALLGLVAGLSLGNHLTIVLLLIPLAYWLTSSLRWRRLLMPLWPALALVLGVMVYIYLPISASNTPVVNWGGANTIKGFLWDITGGPYHTDLHLFSTSIFGNVLDRISVLFKQLDVVGLFLALAGALYLVRRVPRLFEAGAAFALLMTLYSAAYDVRNTDVYMIPVVVVLAIWAGVGLFYLMESLLTLMEARWPSYLKYGPMEAMAVAALVLVPGITGVSNFSAMNLHSDRTDYKYYNELIGSLPLNTIVMVTSSGDDTAFGMWYVRYVERTRQDVTVVVTPLLQFDWYWNDLHKLYPDRIPANAPAAFGDRLFDIVHSNVGQVPVYATSEDPYLNAKFTLTKNGDSYAVTPR